MIQQQMQMQPQMGQPAQATRSMGQASAAPTGPQVSPAMGPASASPAAGIRPQLGVQLPNAQPAQSGMRNMMLSAGQLTPQAPGGYPSYGQQWQPQQGGQPQQSQWQMPWQQFGGGMAPMPQQQPAPQQPPQQSMLQQALAGGSNPQQTQNFLHALQQAGAGSNNAYMSSGAQPQQQAQQLIGAPVQDNGGYGQMSYAGGFNGGMGGVSYNSGLAARPAAGGGTQMNPQGNTFYQGMAPQNQYSQPSGAPQQQNATNPTQSMPGLSGAPQAGGMSAGAMANRPSALKSMPDMGAGMGGMLGGAAAMSDERAKENILPGAEQTREFLSHLNAWEYDYKDPKHGEGRYVSPMAQELEKTPIGKSAVVETPEGKMVHYGRLAGVMLAADADFHKRLTALENKK